MKIVRETAVGLSVLASDDGGEAALTYTWSVATESGFQVFYSANASNVEKNTTATFEGTGDFAFTVVVTDALGQSASSAVNVRVVQTADSIEVSPGSVVLPFGATPGLQRESARSIWRSDGQSAD